MRLHEIIEQLNFREKNSFLKIINELIPISKNRNAIDKIISSSDGELKNLDSVLISEVFEYIESDFERFLRNEFLDTSSQFDLLIDIVSRDGNAIMNREWFYSLYSKEIKELKKKLKVLQSEMTSGNSNIAPERLRDYRIYQACVNVAYQNDLANNSDSKITSDELSILVTLTKELALSQEEIRLINYLVIPISQKDVQETIDELRNKGVLFYSQKQNKVFIAEEVVRVLRAVRGKEVADKHFRRTLKTLLDSQINLVCRKHNIDWKLSRDQKIRLIIKEGLSFTKTLSEDIFKPDLNLTDRKKIINGIAEKLNIANFGGSTLEAKLELIIDYFIHLEKEEKLGISTDGYERLMIDLGSSLKSINKQLKEEFELSEENVLSGKYLLDYNIKPRDVLDILDEDSISAFCKEHNISTRGDEISNILKAYQDLESLYIENYHLIGNRDLNALKENGLQIKEADIGLKFENLTASILENLGFSIDNHLKRQINNKKNQIDILINLGDNNIILVECKTSKENYTKFSSVSRQIKAYKELTQSAGYSVIKTLLIAPNFSDEFVNDCRDDFELNLSLIEAKTLLNIFLAFKESGLKKINQNLFMRDVLIQEELVLKGLKR
ncbi:hypothetical protein AWW67_03980 [Roseivirga seohaensis]|uniref:Uncharacterized protein n=1 Tax=Roseivirga seohaensis TaxID=1914963 RepID=A0A150Y027_9BACT|nr:hypothetical protein [Roseivirga seohaensis]KYG84278.1 hypothetical protein AWW67_03980 [Roseivirga seohaensis]